MSWIFNGGDGGIHVQHVGGDVALHPIGTRVRFTAERNKHGTVRLWNFSGRQIFYVVRADTGFDVLVDDSQIQRAWPYRGWQHDAIVVSR